MSAGDRGRDRHVIGDPVDLVGTPGEIGRALGKQHTTTMLANLGLQAAVDVAVGMLSSSLAFLLLSIGPERARGVLDSMRDSIAHFERQRGNTPPASTH